MKIIKRFNLESRDIYERYLMDLNDDPLLDDETLKAKALESYKRAIESEDEDQAPQICEKKKAIFKRLADRAEMIACMQDLDFKAEIQNTIGTICFAGDCLFFDDEITFLTHRKWFKDMVNRADGLWFSVTKRGVLQIHLDYELAESEEKK